MRGPPEPGIPQHRSKALLHPLDRVSGAERYRMTGFSPPPADAYGPSPWSARVDGAGSGVVSPVVVVVGPIVDMVVDPVVVVVVSTAVVVVVGSVPSSGDVAVPSVVDVVGAPVVVVGTDAVVGGATQAGATGHSPGAGSTCRPVSLIEGRGSASGTGFSVNAGTTTVATMPVVAAAAATPTNATAVTAAAFIAMTRPTVRRAGWRDASSLAAACLAR